MHKKLIYGMFFCLLTFLATTAYAQYWGDAGDFEYTGDDGVITITGYNGSEVDIVIPSNVIGMSVTTIGGNAFRENTAITSVTIPEGITEIGASAFKDCTGLASVSLPSSLENIGSSAFVRTALTSVVIPNAVTVINGSVFYECASLASITIPESVLSIGSSAFRNCEALASITIPAGVTTISASAFSGCIALTSVNIPALVGSLSTSAFAGCSSMTRINIDAANANYTSEDGVVYDKLKENLLIFPAGKSGAFTVPDGVITIGKQSFNKCTAVTDVTVPSSVTTIVRQAFYLSSITSVNVPASVTSIQAQAFRGCPNLISITVDPAHTVYSSVAGVLYSIDGTTLIQCPGGLAGTFTVPSGVTTVPAHAFSEASALTSVTFSDTVTSIALNCADSVITITDFIVAAANPNFSSLNGVLYNKNQTTLLLAPKGIAGHFTIPDGVTELADNSFGSCKFLTTVTIPDSVTTLNGGWASGSFSNSGLTSVTIPDSVTTLVGPTFYGCMDLTSVHIGSGVSNGGVNQWTGAAQPIPGGLLWECRSLEIMTVDPANTELISIDNVIYDKSGTKLLYFPLGRAGTFTVPDGVISIEASALRAAHLITEITIPGSVTNLGSYSLSPMNSLATVNMAEGLETIGRGALRYNPNLTRIDIPASVTLIDRDAFLGNWRMSSAYFLGNTPAPEIGTNAFGGTAADFHVCYEGWGIGFLDPTWDAYRIYPIAVCDDPTGDMDVDGIQNYLDNCLRTSNADQLDSDDDGLGDACDNCPIDANANQKDTCADDTGGDVCNDTDEDGSPDACDNCPDAFNPVQGDADGNDIGNICEEGPPCYVNVEITSGSGEMTEATDTNCDGVADNCTTNDDCATDGDGYTCVDNQCQAETLVSLDSFTATPESNKVILNWGTSAEIDNAGFNIYRAENDGEYKQLNNELIPAEGSPFESAGYEFVDTDASNRTAYSYILEDLDLSGTITQHGPVSATPRLIYLFISAQ